MSAQVAELLRSLADEVDAHPDDGLVAEGIDAAALSGWIVRAAYDLGFDAGLKQMASELSPPRIVPASSTNQAVMPL